jgi:ABC-2 type transport system ATP-binding protein
MIVESEGAVEANLVRLEEVTKRFGDVVAVDRVTLNVRHGEVFGLLGPNGAGKTTLINILVGLLRVDAGRAFIRDREVGRTRFEGRRNTGIVPQELAIYEDLTSLENVKFFASLYGLRGRELDKAAREALELSGLADKAKGIPKRFSGGMKRRLNIACAIAHRPKLIIMDEPTVGIDPQSRHHILQSVRRLNREGCTVIYTSHYMEEVEEIAQRIAILDHGKIIALGTKDELEALITDTSLLCVTVAGSLDPEEPNRLRQIPGVKAVEVTDGVVKVTSAREVNTLGPVISHFAGRGIPIRAIETKTPDLETVFLSLTGRSLRD